MKVWARDTDNTKRHCWEGKDNVRFLEGSTDICTQDHSNNPKVVGTVEWLKFIHEWDKVIGRENNIFVAEGNGQLLIQTDGADTSDGRHVYAEEYYDGNDKVSFRIFLANKDGWARIECYNPDLFDKCEETWNRVQASYD